MVFANNSRPVGMAHLRPTPRPCCSRPIASCAKAGTSGCGPTASRSTRPRPLIRPSTALWLEIRCSRELATARWGYAVVGARAHGSNQGAGREAGSQGQDRRLQGITPDGAGRRYGQLRNVKSKDWTRRLGVENRCVVPFYSFSEFNKAEGGDIRFAVDETRPLACFAAARRA